MSASHLPDPKVLLRIDSAAVRTFLIDFLRAGLRDAGFDRVVLGLSGGIDSALACYLAAEAIGPANVLALWLPYRTSNPESRHDAFRVIESLGVFHKTIEITPLVEPYFQSVPDCTPVRRGNIMARARMLVIYDQSAAWQGMVVGTSNKTERWLGYGTLHGDIACGINPLGGLYKTQVRQLAHHLNVPASIQAKPPSADLWEGQTDEGELGYSYADMDRVLCLLVDAGLSVEALCAAGHSPALVHAIHTRIVRSAFKRRLPPFAELPADLQNGGHA